MSVPKSLLDHATRTLLEECFEGPSEKSTWFISTGRDTALLPTLAGLDAAAASRRHGGHPSVAAHVNHLRYSLSLANRWAAGEDPYRDADWAGSWSLQEVSAQEWDWLRAELRIEYQRWREALAAEREWDKVSLTGVLASVAHAAYHLGAIRQLTEPR